MVKKLDTFYTDEQGDTVRKLSLPPLAKARDFAPGYGFYKYVMEKRPSDRQHIPMRGDHDEAIEEIFDSVETSKSLGESRPLHTASSLALLVARGTILCTYQSTILGALGAGIYLGIEQLLK
ncbi:MAG: hypothetical protein AAB895_01170 [Patescibacteria group bacterium]